MPARPKKLPFSFPKAIRIAKLAQSRSGGTLAHVTAADARKGRVGPITITGLRRFMALERFKHHWIAPRFGSVEELGASQHEMVFLLGELEDQRVVVVVPLVDATVRCGLMGSGDKLQLSLRGRAGSGGAKALFVAAGDDAYELIDQVMADIADTLRSFRLRRDKPVPSFVDYFGWCTWDAFYHEVDAKKVLKGLESFKKGGLAPRFVVLDDGWQDVADSELRSFRCDEQKFPGGLTQLISTARSRYGVEVFGVWHTLMGYWRGIHPKGELAKEYHLERSAERFDHWTDKKSQSRHAHLIHREDLHRFYQDFYRQLAAQGVTMTKVDNQTAVSDYAPTSADSVEVMRAHQEALQGAAFAHLAGNTLHCMSNDNEVAYFMNGSVAWRNSDDFYPRKPESHARHVHANGMNNLWTRSFSIPDWDMFQSKHEAGAFHAAARALSGGPVYVSDKPGHHDVELLAKLATSDGRALRSEAPAKVAPDCLFIDCHRSPHLFKITNMNGAIGMLGVFNCHEDPSRTIAGRFSPSDVPGLAGGRFAVYRHEAGELEVLGRRQSSKLDLAHLGYEVFTISPIEQGFAALGLLNKFNGSRAIEGKSGFFPGGVSVQLLDGGRFGAYCQRAPQAVRIDGKKTRSKHHPKNGLLVIDVPVGRPVRIDIQLR